MTARKFSELRVKMSPESRERAKLRAERILFEEEEFRIAAELYCRCLNGPPTNEATHATSDAMFALLARHRSLLRARILATREEGSG